MKWRNSKERELLAAGGSREQTLPNKNNPHPDLSDADGDKPKLDLTDVQDISPAQSPTEQQRSPVKENSGVVTPTSTCFSAHGYQLYDGMDYESSNDSEEEINVTWFGWEGMLMKENGWKFWTITCAFLSRFFRTKDGFKNSTKFNVNIYECVCIN